MKNNYTKADIVNALKSVGISKGDSIFIHSNIGFFGRLEGAAEKEHYYKAFKDAILEVVGEEGTFVVPTFSYTFCKGEFFDVDKTSGVCGYFSEMVREDKDSIRSNDPNFSISAIGKNAVFFADEPDNYSFGTSSFWKKFMDKGGKICNFNFDSGSTFIHYVERELQVPYRYDKAFKGTYINKGKEETAVFYHFVYDLNMPQHIPDFTKFDKRAKQLGITKCVDLGKGQVVTLTAEDTFRLIDVELKKDIEFLTKGTVKR